VAAPPPAQQKQIVSQAAQRYGIPPALLWGVYGTESGFGRNLGPSSAGAVGYFQFEPSTAASMGVNPYDFASAANGAAKYLSQYKGRGVAGMLSAYNAGPAGGMQPSYVSSVLGNAKSWGGPNTAVSLSQMPGAGGGGGGGVTTIQGTAFNQAAYQKAQNAVVLGNFLAQQAKTNRLFGFGGSGNALAPFYASGQIAKGAAPDASQFIHPVTYKVAQGSLQNVAGVGLRTHPGAYGYVNPIPGANIGRTDMGIDATLPAGHPIVAMGDSRVVGISPNWYKGQPYVLFQLLGGPAKGKYYYVAEAINPTVRVGQTVRAGQTVGTFNPGGTGLELGWGSPTPGRTLAQATTGYSEGQATQAGQSFRNFLGF
jgi:hypothetical protein